MNKMNLETLASLAKRRGFIYQGSEIYGGLAGTWDYGPLGVVLKRNIVNLWWKTFVEDSENIFGLDTAILMSPKVWEASGHTATFNDPVIEDSKTKKQYRLDHLLEDNGIKTDGMTLEDMSKAVTKNKLKSPEGNTLAKPNQFNLMFKTQVGPLEGQGSVVYLRPETAQGMFVNFKNVVDSIYPDIPFGLAQIGRNFRNEISPRDFVFRSRELEIMELEYFVNPKGWEKEFDNLVDQMDNWFTKKLQLKSENVKKREITGSDRAHYSKKTIDFEYKYPIGVKEIAGIAYRTDFDLSSHQKMSGKNLEYIPKDGSEKYLPHVIEPTFGVDRHVLAVLTEFYREDKVNGEDRVFLALPAHLAPVKVAVFPLLKNKPELIKKARELFAKLKSEYGAVMWDDNGNIGKRYRRQDEIGTPYCVTVDFQSLDDDTFTIRDRDTTEQVRLSAKELSDKLSKIKAS
jgi:glycyl-tRNA synthetase